MDVFLEIAVQPRTVAELRSYFDRTDPLEDALDVSFLELDEVDRAELQSLVQSLQPGNHDWIKTVVVDVATFRSFGAAVDFSVILTNASSLENLAIAGADDFNRNLTVDDLERRADQFLWAVLANEDCQLKTFKTTIATKSAILTRFLSSPRLQKLERLHVCSDSALEIEQTTLESLCQRMLVLEQLNGVAIDCFSYETTIALVQAASHTVKELDLSVLSEWCSPDCLQVLKSALQQTRVKSVRLRTSNEERVNALEFLSEIIISPTIEDLELHSCFLLDERYNGIRQLSFNETVRSLRLRECRIGHNALALLNSMKGLSSLEILDCIAYETHPRNVRFSILLPNLPRLKRLAIANFHPAGEALEELANAVSWCEKLESVELVVDMSRGSDDDALDRVHAREFVRNCGGCLSIQMTGNDIRQGILGCVDGLLLHKKRLTHVSFSFTSPSLETASDDLKAILEAARTVRGLRSLRVSVDATNADGTLPTAVLNDECIPSVRRLLGSDELVTLGIGRCRIPETTLRELVDELRNRTTPIQLHFDSVVFEDFDLLWFGSEIQHLSYLKELKVSTALSRDAEAYAFLELIPSMQHLNVLGFEPELVVTTANGIGELLVDGVFANASLTDIQGVKFTPGTYESKRRFEFTLQRNRYGWRLLSLRHVPAAAWPHVLAKITNDSEDATPFLFTFLREMMVRTRAADSE